MTRMGDAAASPRRGNSQLQAVRALARAGHLSHARSPPPRPPSTSQQQRSRGAGFEAMGWSPPTSPEGTDQIPLLGSSVEAADSHGVSLGGEGTATSLDVSIEAEPEMTAVIGGAQLHAAERTAAASLSAAMGMRAGDMGASGARAPGRVEVGDLVEVWTKSGQAWVAARVTGLSTTSQSRTTFVDGRTACVSYRLPDGRQMQKQIRVADLRVPSPIVPATQSPRAAMEGDGRRQHATKAEEEREQHARMLAMGWSPPTSDEDGEGQRQKWHQKGSNIVAAATDDAVAADDDDDDDDDHDEFEDAVSGADELSELDSSMEVSQSAHGWLNHAADEESDEGGAYDGAYDDAYDSATAAAADGDGDDDSDDNDNDDHDDDDDFDMLEDAVADNSERGRRLCCCFRRHQQAAWAPVRPHADSWKIGDRCEVFSKSAGVWCGGQITAAADGVLTIEYQSGLRTMEKRLVADSADLRRASAKPAAKASRNPGTPRLTSRKAGSMTPRRDERGRRPAVQASPTAAVQASPPKAAQQSPGGSAAAARNLPQTRPRPTVRSSPPTAYRPLGPNGRRPKPPKPSTSWVSRQGPLRRTLSGESSGVRGVAS
jgi:hypothetical protein